jgi:hypothetical protein
LRGGSPPSVPARSAPRAAVRQAPAAVAAKPPQTPPAPRATSADAPGVWRDIVQQITAKHPLRSAWLDKAGEVSEEDGALRVIFPRDHAKQLNAPHAKEQGKQIEQLWKKATGRSVVFRPEATGDAAPEAPVAAAPAPTADDFENDPGIEAAIELFGATLEPEEKS